MTTNLVCATVTQTTASFISSINPNVVPSLAIVAGANPACSGSNVSFTASAVNGGGSPSIQWFVNGASQPTNGTNFQSSTFANGDSVFARLTSSAACALPKVSNSNVVTMTINPVVTPVATISVNNNPVCATQVASFTASVQQQGTNPVYNWYKNSSLISTGSLTINAGRISNNDTIWFKLTASGNCLNTNVVNSNRIVMTVNPCMLSATPNDPIENKDVIWLDNDKAVWSSIAYPNPANQMCNIRIEASKDQSDLRIELLDALGKQLRSKDEGKMYIGLSTFSIDLSEFEQGTYFVRIVSGDQVKIHPIMIVR
jgi:hypothetical protein